MARKFLNHARLIGFVLACLAVETRAADDAPLTAARVIAEAQQAIAKEGGFDSRAKSELAVAQTYLNDLDSAWRTLGPLATDDVWNWSGYANCAVVQIRLTEKHVPLPEGALSDSTGSIRFILAKAFAEVGNGTQVVEHLLKPETPAPIVSHRIASEIVPPLLKAGLREDALRALHIQRESYEGDWSRSTQRSGVEDMVRCLVEIDEKAEALKFCQEWETKLAEERDVRKHQFMIGQAWGKLGYCYWLCDEKAASEHALSDAMFWFDESFRLNRNQNSPPDAMMYAEMLAEIGARQRAVLGKDEGLGAYERAFRLADEVVPTRLGFYAYVNVVKRMLEASDIDGADRAIQRVQYPPDRARCYCEFAEHYLASGKNADAAAAALLGVEELKKQSPRAAFTTTTVRLARCLGLANEKDAAREAFTFAKELSAITANFDHPRIARSEIEVGLFEDAYATIQLIPDAPKRLVPLAELARELAREEAFAKRAEPEAEK